MSELFDKEVNAQKEFEKNFGGSRKLPHAHEKCAMKMKQRKNDVHIKIFLVEGSPL